MHRPAGARPGADRRAAGGRSQAARRPVAHAHTHARKYGNWVKVISGYRVKMEMSQ